MDAIKSIVRIDYRNRFPPVALTADPLISIEKPRAHKDPIDSQADSRDITLAYRASIRTENRSIFCLFGLKTKHVRTPTRIFFRSIGKFIVEILLRNNIWMLSGDEVMI